MSTLQVANVHLDSAALNRLERLSDNRVRLTSANTLSFFTSNTERAVILTTGNVGIGITAPTTLLHVNGQSNIVSSLLLAGINVAPALADAYNKANTVSASNSNGFGTRYVSTGTPTGGNDGDIWYKVDA
jgi:hypothetical protein